MHYVNMWLNFELFRYNSSVSKLLKINNPNLHVPLLGLYIIR